VCLAAWWRPPGVVGPTAQPYAPGMNKKADGSRIRALREERLWTQEQLAEVSGIGLRTLQRAEQGESVSVETLKALGALFKIDADELVAREGAAKKPRPPDHNLALLPRLVGASQIGELIQGHGYVFSNDDPKTSNETEALAAFLDNLRDWGDVWGEIGPGERLKAAMGLREQLDELEALGFWAFGMKRPKLVQAGAGDPLRWEVAYVVVVRAENPSIVKKAGEDESAVLPTLVPVKSPIAF